MIAKFISLLSVVAALCSCASAQTFQISSKVAHPEAGYHPVVLYVETTGPYTPADQLQYGDRSRWTVCLKNLASDKTLTKAPVDSVTYDSTLKMLYLHLAVSTPVVTDGRDIYWNVYNSLPIGNDCTTALSPIAQWPDPANPITFPQNQPFIRPVKPTETATMSLAGSFTAGGGIKPIYAIKEIGNITPTQKFMGSHHYPDLLRYDLLPEFTSEVDINQSTSASSKPTGYRSRVDPDTISVGIVLNNAASFKHGPFFYLYTDLQAADFEFARANPSSAYVGGFNTKVIAKPLQSDDGTKALNADIYFGLEAGHNLNKPRMLDGVAVDLSQYNSILRGVPGADVTFNIESSDWSSAQFTIGATWRLRLPALDEPFVTDFHE